MRERGIQIENEKREEGERKVRDIERERVCEQSERETASGRVREK